MKICAENHQDYFDFTTNSRSFMLGMEFLVEDEEAAVRHAECAHILYSFPANTSVVVALRCEFGKKNALQPPEYAKMSPSLPSII